MRVSALAKKAGVTADTVRHYTRLGLLKPERDPSNGYQIYDTEALKYLRFFQKARLLGFSLSEIETIVHHEHEGTSPCPMVRQLMGRHLTRVREQINELQQQLTRMEQAMQAWEQMPDGEPSQGSICPLIEHWSNQEPSGAEK
ncbi:MerR family transcriptional regulator [Aestuariirhabdus litorea]|uniref:MerR family transcriptional regulator n=1 Tax=Aestuariirhabdus litorea TaxID=2528527 RepID=A0A3P3VQZ0_9GAMM|nr:MerR family transcriptional regulator [Aestuariirhabdus litorea]RRJ84727.1 MerR family transcriptional regulator [Aestuariirhabdus litorea]RWW97952.1 MerR family transcriptional regulator [Endozoicomonadaceae bacterium GTF-13]